MPPKSDADSVATNECDDCQIEAEMESYTTVDSNIFGNENGNGASPSESSKESTPVVTPTSIDPLQSVWANEFPGTQIVVAEISKLNGLGISLEGTVEVEGGIEKHPHHYIRSILQEGPVAIEGTLKPGDELLQVNEHKLQGLTHIDVVKILKDLPSNVKVVCARGNRSPSIINTSQNLEAFESRSIIPSGHLLIQGLQKAQSESSLYTSSTATITDQQRSKSVEQVSGLALWTSEAVFIEIEKTERGFGFSILGKLK